MKKELRRQVIAQRMALNLETVQLKSQMIAEKVFGLSEFCHAQVIMTYLPFRNEVDTELIIRKALEQGKRIVVPISEPQEVKLIPAEVKNYPHDLQAGTYGILEPKPEAFYPVEPQEIDLLLMPGVAFDLQGNRLGYGAGYYDRFLDLLLPDVATVALAFELQVKQEVYPQSHDKPVDMIVTEKRIIKPKAI